LNERSYSNNSCLHGAIASRDEQCMEINLVLGYRTVVVIIIRLIRLLVVIVSTTSRFYLFPTILPSPMVLLRKLVVSPPLMNSSSPWASERDQLQELFDSPYTGAVTTRTATLTGFRETPEHTVGLFVSISSAQTDTHLGGCPYE
jgi:hypothetical protein